MQWNRRNALAACLILPMLYNNVASAQTTHGSSFQHIVDDVRARAKAKGVSNETLDRALTNVQSLPGLKKFEYAQAEHVKSYTQYIKDTVTPIRIATGKQMMVDHAALLQKMETQYGVPPQVIVAIWGMETNFGKNTGNIDIIPALLTLAQIGKNQDRRNYFRGEAVQALRILDMGYNQILDKKGSWAGAFGQAQFMPSSFLKLAVDGDGDGKADIWSNHADIFASIASHLADNTINRGWRKGEGWGQAVYVPSGFNSHYFTDKLKDQILKTADQWAALGVRKADGTALDSDPTSQMMMIAPDGPNGPTFMVGNNFKSVMQYNSSYKYAMAVLLLGEAVKAASSVNAAPGLNP